MTLPSLPTDLAQFVIDQIGAGKYASEADVVVDGLRLLRDRERRLTELRDEIQPALDRLERGEGRALNLEEVQARGMARMQR
jgi:putative addiction module CopG family antidote